MHVALRALVLNSNSSKIWNTVLAFCPLVDHTYCFQPLHRNVSWTMNTCDILNVVHCRCIVNVLHCTGLFFATLSLGWPHRPHWQLQFALLMMMIIIIITTIIMMITIITIIIEISPFSPRWSRDRAALLEVKSGEAQPPPAALSVAIIVIVIFAMVRKLKEAFDQEITMVASWVGSQVNLQLSVHWWELFLVGWSPSNLLSSSSPSSSPSSSSSSWSYFQLK